MTRSEYFGKSVDEVVTSHCNHIIMSNRGFGYTKTGRLSGTLEPVSNTIPEAGDDEVVIKIKAMALNPVDEQLCVGPRCF